MILQLKAEVDQLSSSFAINSKDTNELQSHHDQLSEILHQLEVGGCLVVVYRAVMVGGV